MDAARIRRETIRWKILQALSDACPPGAFGLLVLKAIRNEFRRALQKDFTDVTLEEFRRNSAYLEKRGLITLERCANSRLFYQLTPTGDAVARYTAPAGRGIIRPFRHQRRKTDKPEQN